MRYDVVLTEDAELDLEHIYRYIAEHASKASADYVLKRLLEVSDSLAAYPKRGSIPKELLAYRTNGMAAFASDSITPDCLKCPHPVMVARVRLPF